MNYLVYQAYGNRANIDECLYSIYSGEQYIRDSIVVIYTDQKLYLEKMAPTTLQIVYKELDASRIKAWRGKQDFVHRVKIMMLIDLVNDLAVEDCVLYLDGDTKIRTDLSPIFTRIKKGELFMHEYEGVMEEHKQHRIFRKVLKYKNSNQRYSHWIPSQQAMWNAGAIGFKVNFRNHLDRVLEITDRINEEFSSHIVEQLAFSIVIADASKGQVNTLDKEIYHYWNFKEFRTVLKQFFDVNSNEIAIQSEWHKIDPEKLIQPKLTYQGLPKWQKWLKSLQGKWQLKEYVKH